MRLVNFLATSYEHLCHVISPPYCACCRTLMVDRTVLCTSCLNDIKPIVSQVVPVSKGYAMVVHTLSKYENPLKSLILRKNNQDPLASVQLGKLIARHLAVENMDIDCLVPVPLHWTRYARRGFNQAEIIARELAHRFHVPSVPLVKRTKKTLFQSMYTGTQRLKNVEDAFILAPGYERFEKKHLVLVDDLMTTGATLQSVAKTLIPLKPASLTAIVACRT